MGGYEMMHYTMRRVRKTGSETIGLFIFDYRPIWTLEDPDKNNLPKVSCIPADTYLLQLVKSGVNRGIGLDVAYSVMNVPGRNLIRFLHPVYDENDVEGCIGGGFGVDFKVGAVLQSKKACAFFYRRMQEINGLNPIKLTIIDC